MFVVAGSVGYYVGPTAECKVHWQLFCQGKMCARVNSLVRLSLELLYTKLTGETFRTSSGNLSKHTSMIFFHFNVQYLEHLDRLGMKVRNDLFYFIISKNASLAMRLAG